MIIVEKSAAGGSAGSILLLPEGNEDNTAWLSHEGIKPASDFNKMKPDDIATVRKRKQMIAEEVTSSVVDKWLRDQVNRKTWEKNIYHIRIPPRYQVYGITLKLNADKDDW